MPKYTRVSLFARTYTHVTGGSYVQRRCARHNARACCALAFEGEYTRGAQAVLSLSRARLSRAFVPSSARRSPARTYVHTLADARATHVYVRVQISSHRCGRPWYIPAPGTNIIACRDKFIAAVPQPLANVPRLRRKMRARGGGQRGKEGGATLETPAGRREG